MRSLLSRFPYSLSLMLDIFILLNRLPSVWLTMISYTSWVLQLSALATLFFLRLICITSKSNLLKKAIHCASLALNPGWVNKQFCWCICNFGMYSLLYLIFYPNVPIWRFINIINSCKFNEVNPLLKVREIVPTIELRLTLLVDKGSKSPQLRCTRVIRLC